jgi:hypothetical protein
VRVDMRVLACVRGSRVRAAKHGQLSTSLLVGRVVRQLGVCCVCRRRVYKLPTCMTLPFAPCAAPVAACLPVRPPAQLFNTGNPLLQVAMFVLDRVSCALLPSFLTAAHARAMP